jgi:hypothetical protein
MTTILILNAVSSFLAAIGIVVWENRRVRRQAAVVPVYVATSASRSRR